VANITLTVPSAWSTCSDNTNTGTTPGATDNIYLNGYNLTLDGPNGSTYTCASIRGTTGDGVTPALGNIIPSNASSTINANLTAGTTTSFVTTGGKTLAVNGNCVGGSSGNSKMFNVSGTSTLIVTGDITGGSATSAVGISSSGTGNSVTVTGTVMGGTALNATGVLFGNGDTGSIGHAIGSGTASAAGVSISAGANVLVTIAEGGGALGAHGVSVSAAGIVTVETAKGGTVAGVYGVTSTSTASTIILDGTDLTGTGYPVATLGMLQVAAGVVLQFSDQSSNLLPFYSGVISANFVLAGHTNYAGGSPGLVVLPGVGDVRAGTPVGIPPAAGTLNVAGQARVIGG
jgi:hypothetical protein